jgi:hypothetical protein
MSGWCWLVVQYESHSFRIVLLLMQICKVVGFGKEGRKLTQGDSQLEETLEGQFLYKNNIVCLSIKKKKKKLFVGDSSKKIMI